MIVPCSLKVVAILLITALYVDDIVVTGSNEAGITHFKQHLHSTFNIKDLGLPNFFLSIEVSDLSSGIITTQKKGNPARLQVRCL